MPMRQMWEVEAMTDAAKIARGLTILAVATLSGCGRTEACVDGKLYLSRGDDVYVRDEWDRTCVTKSEIAVRAELERIADE